MPGILDPHLLCDPEHDIPNGMRSQGQHWRCELDQLPKSPNRATESLFQQFVLGLLRAPQFEVGLDARLYFLELEGLGDVVDSTGSKPLYLVLDRIQSAEENHGDVRKQRAGLQPFTYFVAVHLRHIDVQQNQVRRFLVRRRKRQPAQTETTALRIVAAEACLPSSFRFAGLSSTTMMLPLSTSVLVIVRHASSSNRVQSVVFVLVGKFLEGMRGLGIFQSRVL